MEKFSAFKYMTYTGEVVEKYQQCVSYSESTDGRLFFVLHFFVSCVLII